MLAEVTLVRFFCTPFLLPNRGPKMSKKSDGAQRGGWFLALYFLFYLKEVTVAAGPLPDQAIASYSMCPGRYFDVGAATLACEQ
jgi:hypothetical protein